MIFDAGKIDDFEEKKIVSYKYEKHQFCVVKLNSEFKSFRNVCPHQYVPLDDAIIKDNWIVCRMHGWLFDLNTGVCGVMPNCSLPIYKTEIVANKLLVNLPD